MEAQTDALAVFYNLPATAQWLCRYHYNICMKNSSRNSLGKEHWTP